MREIKIPSVYQAGYEKASALNPSLAAKYIEYTTIDDPIADDAVESLVPFDTEEMTRLIKGGIDQDEKTLANAPQPLRDFFDQIPPPPPWYNANAVRAGCQAFHAYSDLFIPAFVVVTLQNISTLIGKSFHMTGRVETKYGSRRIKQNIRHLIEIMLPGALNRQGDGWKLSVRTRLIHAQIRHLIRASGTWDESIYGTPLSTAHIAFASANFSTTLMDYAERLGASLDAEARVAFMQIWRCAGLLLGTPEELLFEGDEAMAAELCRIALACEPLPGEDAIMIAHALIKTLPDIAGKTDPAARQSMVNHVYRVARALLGDELADQLEFPRQSTVGLLTWMKGMRQFVRVSHRMVPNLARKWRGNNFVFLLEASALDDVSYRIPDHLKAEQATPW